MSLVDQLSRQGIPYGVRKDGSVFIIKDGFDIVEMGIDETPPTPNERSYWTIIDRRWVLMDRIGERT